MDYYKKYLKYKKKYLEYSIVKSHEKQRGGTEGENDGYKKKIRDEFGEFIGDQIISILFLDKNKKILEKITNINVFNTDTVKVTDIFVSIYTVLIPITKNRSLSFFSVNDIIRIIAIFKDVDIKDIENLKIFKNVLIRFYNINIAYDEYLGKIEKNLTYDKYKKRIEENSNYLLGEDEDSSFTLNGKLREVAPLDYDDDNINQSIFKSKKEN
jgi:hypothetical protein